MDIDLKIQLQMVRDRFIDGQAESALRRHLDSLGPNTAMTDIVDCCRMWKRHCEVEIQPRKSADRRPVRVIRQVTAVSPEKETIVDIINKLLPTSAPPPLQAVPIRSDRDLLIQQLMEVICPPTPIAEERQTMKVESILLNQTRLFYRWRQRLSSYYALRWSFR